MEAVNEKNPGSEQGERAVEWSEFVVHSSQETGLALANVNFMKRNGLSCGDLILVRNLTSGGIVEQEQKIGPVTIPLRIWPSQAAKSGYSMARENCEIDIGGRGMFTKLRVPPLAATSVSVCPCQPLVGKYLLVGNRFLASVNGCKFLFEVTEIQPIAAPNRVVFITPGTRIHVIPAGDCRRMQKEDCRSLAAGWHDIGGLNGQKKALKETLRLLGNYKRLSKFGIYVPKGILLYGPSGTGKTFLIRAVVHQCSYSGISVFELSSQGVTSKFVGESEKKVREVFSSAVASAPSVVIMDELDSMCPRKELMGASGEMERRICMTMCAQLDTLDGSAGVLILAATNCIGHVDPSLRRAGRIDREIELGVPSRNEREEILTIHLKNMPHCLSREEVHQVASCTHGYVGADLNAICRDAANICQNRWCDGVNGQDYSKGNGLVTEDDVLLALSHSRPSGMREVVLDVPRVSWDDIGGHSEIKMRLQEAVQWPLQHPQAFQRMGIRTPRGILLYGPPGCAKTMMAQALATEAGLNFVAVKGPQLFRKWVGESERAVSDLFRRARQNAPSIIFFDEIDGLVGSRKDQGENPVSDRVLGQLLTEIDGIRPLQSVVVVAATNRPDLIDPALLRPGRFDRILFLPPPRRTDRLEILNVHLRKIPHEAVSQTEKLVDESPSSGKFHWHRWPLTVFATVQLEGYSGADIAAVVREAALFALRDSFDSTIVREEHIHKAATVIKGSLSCELIRFYEELSV